MSNDLHAAAWLEDPGGVATAIRGTLVIGRASDCTLRVDSDAISRRHALIHAQGREHWLVDLGSTNGVYLSGRRVRLPTALSDGDVIELCDRRLTFRRQAMWTTEKEKLDSTRRVHHQERSEEAWLLIADIEGSSELIKQLSPKDFAVRVGKWFLACQDLLRKHGAVLHQYLGDGFFAYWPPETGAPGAVLAALEVMRQLRQAGPPPFRVVLHRGMVVIDPEMTVGEDRLLGTDVFFVFHMEKMAARARWPLVLSQRAAEGLAQVTQITALGPRAVRGFTGTHLFFTI
jgi:class 3 adenylate cyclase